MKSNEDQWQQWRRERLAKKRAKHVFETSEGMDEPWI